MRRLAIGFVALLVLATLFVLALVLGAPSGAVDWREMRAVAFESDDWGLQGFVPDATAWRGLDREELAPGRFPPVYWGSTLEDSAAVARLGAVLLAHEGRDGLPAVFQPNYVMSALGWSDVPGGGWTRYDLPDLDPRYRRPGLWEAVTDARAAGVWHPEFHAAWHYDPQRRLEAALEPGAAREATARGVMLFPGSEKARELGPWRPLPDLAVELDRALDIFARIFGRSPGSVIAPDYTWNDRIEDLWASRGLTVIQGKREQRNPDWGGGWSARLGKLRGRSLARVLHPERAYLERNVRFEPVQTDDPRAVADDCVQQTRQAWRRGEPAVVETHRINFAHTDPAVVERGLEAMRHYLAGVASGDDGLPLYLTDSEIAALRRAGVSWRRAGDRVILRNGTRTRRLIVLPAALGDGAPAAADRFVALGAGQTRIFDIDGSKS